MKNYRLMLVAVSAFFCGVSATQAANWVPLEAVGDDAPLVRTNHDDSDDGSNSAVICTSGPTNAGNKGIKGGGRRIGYLTDKGKCKTVGAGSDVTQKTENILVLLDDAMNDNYDPGITGNDQGDIGPGGPDSAGMALLATCLEEAPVGDTMLEKLTNCANNMFPGAETQAP